MTAPRLRELSKLPAWPRLMDRELAAEYCSMSVNHFLTHFPYEATRVGSKKLYDIKLLDRWVDSLNGAADDDDEKYLSQIGNDNPPKERASG